MAVLIVAAIAFKRTWPEGQRTPRSPEPRIVDRKAVDSTLLKATYIAAGKPGPGVLLLHQVHRMRKYWGHN